MYDFTIKAQLLNYCQTAMIFADSNVNNNVITWNRVVLLHGPPGMLKICIVLFEDFLFFKKKMKVNLFFFFLNITKNRYW